MSIRAVGFVPAAPLLIPAIAGGSAGLDGKLREACRTVVADLVAAVGDGAIVVVAPADTSPTPEATWDFAGFGVPRLDRGDQPVLPWPLGIGAWLLDDVGWNGSRSYVGARSADAASAHLPFGAEAVLAVGDGSNCRTDKAPGHFDERAERFDQQIADCLASGNLAGLAGLDAAQAQDLGCVGAEVWRWLAAAAGAIEVEQARLLADVAPYGVGYFAAVWSVG